MKDEIDKVSYDSFILFLGGALLFLLHPTEIRLSLSILASTICLFLNLAVAFDAHKKEIKDILTMADSCVAVQVAGILFLMVHKWLM